MTSIGYSPAFLDTSMMLFNTVGKYTSFFLLPLYLVRAFYFSVSGASPNEVGRLLKSVVLYFMLFYSFSYVLEIILSLPEVIDKEISIHNEAYRESDISFIPYAIRQLLGTITAMLFDLGKVVFSIFILIMSGIAPIVFLLGSILNIGIGLKLFFGLIVIASTWPIMWWALDYMFFYMAKGESGLFVLVLDLFISFLKVAAPFSLGLMAMNSSPASFVPNTVSRVANSLGGRGRSNSFNNNFSYRGGNSHSGKGVNGIEFNLKRPGVSSALSEGRRRSLANIKKSGNSYGSSPNIITQSSLKKTSIHSSNNNSNINKALENSNAHSNTNTQRSIFSTNQQHKSQQLINNDYKESKNIMSNNESLKNSSLFNKKPAHNFIEDMEE
tara:strand:+ start:3283 stop:4434 length:1152 start_codon:yes stop_codon:yes gene_type:complete